MALDRDDEVRPVPIGGGSGELGPLDKLYRDTNTVVLVIFGICCGIIAFVLSLICFLTAKDEKAKANAKLVMIVGVIVFVLSIVFNFVVGFGAMMGGR